MNLSSRWVERVRGRAGRDWPRHCLRRLVTLGALLLAVAIMRLFVGTFVARGVSMEPTILGGDVLLMTRTPTLWRALSSGKAEITGIGLGRSELILLRAGQRGTPVIYAKRVVGLPGDHVAMRNNALWVNGMVVDEPYARATIVSVDEATRAMGWQREYLAAGIDPTRYFPTAGNWGPLQVPVGNYFVLGDNRDRTIDSREFGMVSASDVIGRINSVLVSHDGSCCGLRSLLAGIRWNRVGVDLTSVTRAEVEGRLRER